MQIYRFALWADITTLHIVANSQKGDLDWFKFVFQR